MTTADDRERDTYSVPEKPVPWPSSMPYRTDTATPEDRAWVGVSGQEPKTRPREILASLDRTRRASLESALRNAILACRSDASISVISGKQNLVLTVVVPQPEGDLWELA